MASYTAALQTHQTSRYAIAPTTFAPLRALGIDDCQIEDVVQICCAFHMITRIADALEFDVPDWDTMLRGAKIMLKRGYLPPGQKM